MRYSLYFPILFSVWLFFLLLPALFIYYVDPYQVFRKHTSPDLGLTHNQRYQNVGLINSYLNDPDEHYDSILVGTSLSANFTAKSVQQYLKWKKPLRLFMNGGNPQEQTIVIKYALSNENIKYILWELFPSFYYHPTNSDPFDPKTFPAYLYNDSRLDDYPYLFNQDVLKMAWYAWSRYTLLFPLTSDTLGYWGDNPAILEKHRVFNSIEQLMSIQQLPKLNLQRSQTTAQNFQYPVLNDEVFPLLEKYCNTDTRWILFIPPLSKADYLRDADHASRTIYMTDAVVRKTSLCSNMQIHAFDLMDFTYDLNNYMDREHYLPYINDRILELISKQESLLTLDNVANYEEGFFNILNNQKITSSYQATF